MKRKQKATKGLKKKDGSWWLADAEISQCIYAGSLKWYVQMHHYSGLRWDENSCPQFRTIRSAKEWIHGQWRLEDIEAWENQT